MKSAYLCSGVALIALLADGSSGLGQTAIQGPATPFKPGSNSPQPVVGKGGVEEITVTAQKRTEKINDVPMSITAIAGTQLKRRQISTLADIANIVPGLTYSNSIANTPIYTLRGVGFSDSSLAAYPDVAIYLDEVPLPLPALSKQTAFDLSQVEVLKGPQGTLFGNNATGGAINFIAAKPTKIFDAGVDLSYGRFNSVIGNGYVSGPISDNLQVRLAGHVANADGWQKGYTSDQTNGAVQDEAVRLLVDWQATERLKFSLDLNGWIDKSQPQALQFELYRSNIPGVNAVPGLITYPQAPENDRAADFSSKYYAKNIFAQAALRTTYSLTDTVTITSLTSYLGYSQKEGYDQDGVTYQDFDVPDGNGNIDSFSQELRVDNGSLARLRWIGGLNYSRDTVYENDLFTYADSSAANALDVTAGGAESRQIMNNYAAFINGEYDLIDRLTLKAGGRYTEADRSYNGCSYDVPGGNNRQVFNVIAREVSGTAVPIPPAGGCDTIRDDYLSQGNFTSSLNEANFSFHGGLDYKLAKDMLLYVSIAKGYKAGSYPTQPASIAIQYTPVRQESVLDYEVGFKLGLLNHRLQVNGAGFYYDYTNKQLLSKLNDPVFGLLNDLQNVPKSSIRGAEIEIDGRVTPNVNLTFSGTYLDATIDKFTGYNAAGLYENFEGAAFPYTPRFQFAFGPSYEHSLNDKLNMFAAVQVNYRSATTAVIGGSNILLDGKDAFAINGYTLVDAQLGVRSWDGRWEVDLWAKNLFNTYYWNNVLVGYDTISRYSGMPATYGLTLKYHFL